MNHPRFSQFPDEIALETVLQPIEKAMPLLGEWFDVLAEILGIA